MKKLVGSDVGSYTFSAATKQITFTNVDDLSLRNILVITNLSSNTMLYNFADSTLKGTLSGSVLTLAKDTTAMSNSDELQIWVDTPDNPNENLLILLQRLLNICEPIATQDSAGRQRVTVDAMTSGLVLNATLATSGGANVTGLGYPVTGNTVGNPLTLTASKPTQLVATIVDQRWELCDLSQAAFNTGVRSKLVWS